MLVITGATGRVGSKLLELARAQGWAARAVVRDRDRAGRLAARGGVELFHGNVLHGPSLAGAMDGATCVVHLAGISREWRENTFERVHVQGTAHVVEAARKAGVKRFLYISAIGARADAPSRYHQTKWAAEEQVRASGIAWTILRPSIIYGTGDRFIQVLARVIQRAPVVPVLGTGRSRLQPVAVESVAQSILAALKNDGTIQKTYDLVGPVPFTWNELYGTLLAYYGLNKRVVHVPMPLARVLAGLFESLLANPPFTRDQLRLIEEDNVGDPLPAETDLGLTPESFADGLARCLPK